jgi:error-prone DNA polymerase
MTPAYAELQCVSNYSFLEGASHAAELVGQAALAGLSAIGIADRNSVAGAVRAHIAAKEAGIRLLPGARLDLMDGVSLVAYPQDRAAWGRLCRLITLGRRRAPKGSCELYRQDVEEHGAGMALIALPPEEPDAAFAAELKGWAEAFPGSVWLAASHLLRGDDLRRIAHLAGLADSCGVSLVATNDVLMHDPSRRPLADVLACVREGVPVDTAGARLLLKNGERHIKGPAAMVALFREWPDALAQTQAIAARCNFSLDELRYEYPDEVAPDGRPPQDVLEALTEEGARDRWPAGPPVHVRQQIDHELQLIRELGYAPYFLTVHDIVRFARSQGILCQGRGSAANSAVCYCLGITSVDPARMDLLFERFISAERGEPPDIDVDFEHERREEVIQYIYGKYGRERAGMTATVIHYRPRGAVRDVGKAMGLSRDVVTALAGQSGAWVGDVVEPERLAELGLDAQDRRLRLALALSRQLIGFPRHLSQHVGGFVITRGRLDELVPVENAAMEDRTVIEWDKDDLDALGILKVDVLALGMLSCLRKGLEMIRSHYGREFSLATVPAEDPAVYDMLCRADAIGVFQVESRAQLAFLPRMRPRNFYDLVIEVAIVRPGPIQGDMVHPYIRRRNGEETVDFPSDDLRRVLGKTLGVPLFQEQAMQIAIVAAGFTPAEADGLRRAMATFRHSGRIHDYREKMIGGMLARGYEADFAERCFRQIEGFGEYGFPESHAASFALLVYVSAWMKCHYPAVFACALLNSQPMGFYAPAQIVRDAREHGVEVRPPDVNWSDWDCTLETGAAPDGPAGGYALRLGLRQIKGFREADAEWITAARGNFYTDPLAVWRRAGVAPAALTRLAEADAFGSMGLGRRAALWAVKAIGGETPLPLFDAAGEAEQGAEPPVALPPMTDGEAVVADYRALRLSLRAHPIGLLRERLGRDLPAEKLLETKDGRRVAVSGLVLVRQRPGTAKGVIFITLEDETGTANVIVWPAKFEQFRRQILTGRMMRITGRMQREGQVIHVVADRIEDLSGMLDSLDTADDDRTPIDPINPQADEVRGGTSDDPRGKLRHVVPKLRRHPREQARTLFPSRDFH